MSKGKRITIVIIGFTINSIAISFYLLTGFGPDSVTVLSDGLAQTFGISVGLANLGLTGCFLLTMWLVGKEYIGIATVLALFIVSPGIDIFMHLFEPVVSLSSAFGIRLLFFALAFLLLSFGISLYLSANLGLSVVELLPILVSEKAHIQFRWCKIGFDVTVVVAGILLGGAFGAGTLLSVLGTGPMVHVIRNQIEKRLP